MLDRFKIDDVVGAIPVHLFAGIWGTMVVPATNGDASYATQFISIVIVGVFVGVTAGIAWTILKSTMGIRVGEEEEISGLDVSELGREAYPEFYKG
jgi:Amt family ammonium transporter